MQRTRIAVERFRPARKVTQPRSAHDRYPQPRREVSNEFSRFTTDQCFKPGCDISDKNGLPILWTGVKVIAIVVAARTAFNS